MIITVILPKELDPDPTVILLEQKYSAVFIKDYDEDTRECRYCMEYNLGDVDYEVIDKLNEELDDRIELKV